MYQDQVLTCGDYQTEPDAVSAFLNIVNRDHWQVLQEVEGWMLHPRIDTAGSGRPRIDILLQPRRGLIEFGWRWGVVGIECKKSGTKLGRVISQAMDYTRCVWGTPNGFNIMTRFVFVWPCDPVKNDLESVMIQNRIGVANLQHRAPRLRLCYGSTVAYADNGNGQPHIADELRGGSKQGSR